MDLDVLPSEPVPPSAEAGDARSTGKGVADLIGEVSPSHPSASQDVSTFSSAGSNDDRPLVVDHAQNISSVLANAGAAMVVILGNVSSNVKSASSTRSMLLTNQPSAVARSNRTAESTALTESGSGGDKRLDLRKTFGVKCALKSIKKPEKTARPSKVVLSPGKIEIKFSVLSAAASTSGTFTGPSSTHEISDVEVNDDGALKIPSCFTSGKDGTSGP